MSHSNQTPILRLENITKTFGSLVALDDVSIEVNKGEILAILGENGAGKSTLMKILSGLHLPDGGKIHLNLAWFDNPNSESNELVETFLENPRNAMKIGIGMVYQHFQLVEPLSVSENIILGKEFTHKYSPVLNMNEANARIREISEHYGLIIDPKAIIRDLPVGLKQRVEILKQLFRDANLLILDEPTAVLTPLEVEELFKTMRRLRELGKSIIFISHKLKEPIAIADRIIVLRGGKLVGEAFPDKVTHETLAEMVVGKRVLQRVSRNEQPPGDTILTVENLSMKNKNEVSVLKSVSFEIRKGEILGVAGVQGNGQTELIECLIGLQKESEGIIKYYSPQELALNDLSTLQRLKLGIGYIPEDRSVQGLISHFQIKENLWLGFHDTDPSSQHELQERLNIDHDHDDPVDETSSSIQELLLKTYRMIQLPMDLMRRLSRSVIDRYNVKANSEDEYISSLSGGNQQKILVGREFAKDPNLIIASQPTRGVDIGVMEKIHESLINMRNKGAAIFLVSSDLDEVLKLSDRIIVMYEGEVVASGAIDELSVMEISKFMTRGKEALEVEVSK